MATLSLEALLKVHALPAEFMNTIQQWYRPLANDIAERHQGVPLVIGVQGAQGSGKSTLAECLQHLLINEHKLNTVCLSIDDFYLRREDRQILAKKIHPLFATRGVPGTHEVSLGLTAFNELKSLKAAQTWPLVRFNKALDDRHETKAWGHARGPIDILLFEGWCVGMSPQDDNELVSPVNVLEAEEDKDRTWRSYVNHALSAQYQSWFKHIDYLAVLQAPSFECVHQWRNLQEEKLREKLTDAPFTEKKFLLDNAAITRFISHYERLTRHGLRTLPEKADWLFNINIEHTIISSQKK